MTFEDAEPETTSATFKVVITETAAIIDSLIQEQEVEDEQVIVPANITVVIEEEEEEDDEEEPLLVWIESISSSGEMEIRYNKNVLTLANITEVQKSDFLVEFE